MSCPGASRLVALELPGPAGPLEALFQECDGGAARVPRRSSATRTRSTAAPCTTRSCTASPPCCTRAAPPRCASTSAAWARARAASTTARASWRTRAPRFAGWWPACPACPWRRRDSPSARGWPPGWPPRSPRSARSCWSGRRSPPATSRLLRSLATPKLVVQGERDEVCPPADLEAALPDVVPALRAADGGGREPLLRPAAGRAGRGARGRPRGAGGPLRSRPGPPSAML